MARYSRAVHHLSGSRISGAETKPTRHLDENRIVARQRKIKAATSASYHPLMMGIIMEVIGAIQQKFSRDWGK
jgi:hypothetical protein